MSNIPKEKETRKSARAAANAKKQAATALAANSNQSKANTLSPTLVKISSSGVNSAKHTLPPVSDAKASQEQG